MTIQNIIITTDNLEEDWDQIKLAISHFSKAMTVIIDGYEIKIGSITTIQSAKTQLEQAKQNAEAHGSYLRSQGL